MAMALLQAGFDRALGPGGAIVRSVGFGPSGEPPIIEAIEAMRARDLDVSAHRSLEVRPSHLAPADLILTAEKDHVVKIASMSPDAYRRTFTLPEFVRRAEVGAGVADEPSAFRDWVEELSFGRDASVYVAADVGEVWDPTGSSPRRFAQAVVSIDDVCSAVIRCVVAARRDADDTDRLVRRRVETTVGVRSDDDRIARFDDGEGGGSGRPRGGGFSSPDFDFGVDEPTPHRGSRGPTAGCGADDFDFGDAPARTRPGEPTGGDSFGTVRSAADGSEPEPDWDFTGL